MPWRRYAEDPFVGPGGPGDWKSLSYDPTPAPVPGAVPLTPGPNGTWTSPDPEWKHLINRESGGDPNITQHGYVDENTGGNEAEGLFQITPKTWAGAGGDKYGPSPGTATPYQQADIAGNIFRDNPTASDWIGSPAVEGREDPVALQRGLPALPKPPAAPNPTTSSRRVAKYGLPEGEFRGWHMRVLHPGSSPNPNALLRAYTHPDKDNNSHVGELMWDNTYGDGVVDRVKVHPDHQRKGLATAMFDYASQLEGYTPPTTEGSEYESPEGRAWGKAMQDRHASLSPWRVAAEDTEDDDDTLAWMSGVPVDPLDPSTTLHSLLLEPYDAYDQWEWEKRHHDSPPEPTPNHVDWYHVTPADLPVGTVLAPHHAPPWKDNPYHGGLDNRANWIWVEHDMGNSDQWCSYMVRDHGVCHVYRVRPRLGPFPWNGSAKEGWVSDSAVIVEKDPSSFTPSRKQQARLRAANAANAKANGAMVALYPRGDSAYKLAVPTGESPDDLHLTLVYLGENAAVGNPEGLARSLDHLASSYTVVTGQVTGHALLGDDEDAAVYLIGDTSQLPDLHKDVLNAANTEFNVPRQHEPWLPHVTAGYDINPNQLDYFGSVTFDRIGLAYKGHTEFFPLLGAAVGQYA